MPRNASAEVQARARVVLDNVDRLDEVPEARAVVCEMNVRYVYRGAKVSEWDARRYPPLEALRASTGLKEVFSRGEAVVFETRVGCD